MYDMDKIDALLELSPVAQLPQQCNKMRPAKKRLPCFGIWGIIKVSGTVSAQNAVFGS